MESRVDMGLWGGGGTVLHQNLDILIRANSIGQDLGIIIIIILILGSPRFSGLSLIRAWIRADWGQNGPKYVCPNIP